MNKILSLSAKELARGIVAASSGNHGKAIAYASKQLGIGATIVLPQTVAKIKEDTIREYGAEPASLPRYTASLNAGKPVAVERKPTVADALVTHIPGDVCFPYVAKHVDAFADVDEDYLLRWMKLLLQEGKLLCEPSSAIGVGAVLQGLIPVKPSDKVCFLLSGGSVAFDQLKILEEIPL